MCAEFLRQEKPMTVEHMLLCPHCAGDDVHPSRPRGVERVLQLAGLRPFRCYECGERFRSRRQMGLAEGRAVPASVEVRGACTQCSRTTTVMLTPPEKHAADTEGWLISCPGCGALFVLKSGAAKRQHARREAHPGPRG